MGQWQHGAMAAWGNGGMVPGAQRFGVSSSGGGNMSVRV
jgi:hypothetical protein